MHSVRLTEKTNNIKCHPKYLALIDLQARDLILCCTFIQRKIYSPTLACQLHMAPSGGKPQRHEEGIHSLTFVFPSIRTPHTAVTAFGWCMYYVFHACCVSTLRLKWRCTSKYGQEYSWCVPLPSGPILCHKQIT